MRSLKASGMEAVFFKWNDDRARLSDVDGYFIVGGFSYEDRGRSGMVAARDPLMEFIGREAEEGKVVIGNCNGAQILVESGLVPMGRKLDMCLARNIVNRSSAGFLSQHVWMKRACALDRCATSHFDGVMQLPIAHGEGRFTTRDSDLLQELIASDQVAFRYCDAAGVVSDHSPVTPNGSLFAIAGLCNPAGNVVALMPHPERTPNGNPYFDSLREWITTKGRQKWNRSPMRPSQRQRTPDSEPVLPTVILLESLITNNEERTVEAALKRVLPSVTLKQMKYVPIAGEPREYLQHIAHFNPNKEVAYVARRAPGALKITKWNAREGEETDVSPTLLNGWTIVRRDEPCEGDMHAGLVYILRGIPDQIKCSESLLNILANPHAARLTLLRE